MIPKQAGSKRNVTPPSMLNVAFYATLIWNLILLIIITNQLLLMNITSYATFIMLSVA